MVNINQRIGMLLPLLLFPIVLLAGSKISLPKSDTTKVLPPLQVIGLRYPSFFSGTKFQLIDSNQLRYFQQQNLANLLANQSQVFIKNYGPGAIATPGFRGGNANHTLVMWNGISLQSALSGQTDFSLIPAYLLNNIAVQYGSASVLFGSGAIGGVVHLQTRDKENTGQHLQIMSGIGSFGTYSFGGKMQLTGKKWKLQEGVFYQGAENNFTYHEAQLLMPATEVINETISRATHANYKQLSWVQELDVQLGKYHQLGARTWISRMDRNLPSPQGTSPNNGNQEDWQNRFMLDYKRKKGAAETLVRAAYQLEALNYMDQQNGFSGTDAEQISVVADQILQAKSFEFLVSGSYQLLKGSGYIIGSNQNSSFNETQSRAALFGSIKQKAFNGKLQQQVGLRAEQVDGTGIPLMPSYGLQWMYNKSISLLGNVARTYRLPTLNDLYWPLMGNANLLPEQGWNYELTARSNFAMSQSLLAKISVTGYYKQIENWIIWVPKSANLSTPMNVHEVNSKGIELQWSLNQGLGKQRIELSGMHDYTQAMPTKSKLENDASLNKQLIYTPGIKHQLNLQYKIGKTAIQYTWTYTGIRYTASDNSTWLNPYSLSSLYVSQLLVKNKHHFSINASIQNLWNETYQVMANRAMPLRNFQLTLIYTI
jgi:iron complex outermembrane receptor protein